jgi:outer membrane protein OmpA-like peptidoglycan-associated protein
VFPYFGPDATFYFSSDIHPGMGGLDLFSATWENGKFSNVKNLEYPINSGADDFGLLLIDAARFRNSDTLSAGYLSSNRRDGEGNDDIYIFYKTKKKLRPPVYVLQGKILQKVYIDSLDVNSPVVDTMELKGAIATVNYPESLTLLAKYTLKEGELFELQVDSMKEYKISGMMEGFFNGSVIVSTKTVKGKPGDTVRIYSEVVLDKKPLETTTTGGGQIKLKNIYYDLNDTTLRAESFPELDKLVKLLNENPGLIIQINSHTDSRGSDAYNQKLSRGRANSVVAYLVSKGIATERLLAKGWGETLPEVLTSDEILSDGSGIAKGTTLTESLINQYKAKKTDFEFLHQFNRRTTFNIVSDVIEVDPGQGDVKSDLEKEE